MKILNKFIAFIAVLLLVVQLSSINVVAVLGYNTPYPRLSELYFISISSYPDENSEKLEVEGFSNSDPYGFGLSDMRLKAKKKHHRGKVEIYFYQKGYTENTTLTIDGKKITHGYTYDSESGYIPESGKFGVIAWKDVNTAYNIDDTVSESEIKLTATVNDEYGLHTYTQTLTVEWIDDGGPAPASVKFRYDPELNKYILENADSTMEYRLKGSSNSDWKPCADTPMEFPVSAAAYHIRYAATDTEPASKATTITLVGKRAAPSCVYNKTTEVLSGLTDKMEISFSGSDYRPVPSGTTSMSMSDYIDKISDNETLTVSVRYPLESVAPESNAYTQVLYPRFAEPDLEYDAAALTLSGTDSGMAYRLSDAASWTSIYGTVLNLETIVSPDKDVTVLVRYKPTSTNSASREKSFTIAKLIDGPTGTVDYANETISGFDDDVAYQYKYGNPKPGEGGWNDVVIENGCFDISKLIASSSITINIRKAKTATTPITNHTAFNIPKRLGYPASPAFSYNDANHYGKAVLTGVTPEMEYREQYDTLWTSVGDDDIVIDIPDANKAYYVRYKATSENFASQNKSILLREISAGPAPAYNSTTETITNISSAMEISYNGSEYIPIEKGVSSLDLSDTITELTDVLTVNVRYSATAVAPASAAKSILIYPRLAAPTSVSYDKANILLTGINNTMQYRLESSTSWTSLSGTTLNLLSKASAEKDIKVLVRYKPTTANSASLPVEFIIPKLLDGPSCSIDYINEKIIGFDDKQAYQYFIGTNPGTTANWISMPTANGGFDISNIAASTSKNINIRKAATSDEPITNYTALIIPARKTAPKVAFEYNNSSYYNKAVLTGATSDMEYKINGDTSWTPVGNYDIVLDIPSATTKYYVRYKSTAENFASLDKAIYLNSASAAPAPSYNSTTETIINISSAMEISYNGSEYIPVEKGVSSLNLSDAITELTDVLTINVRYSATATAPASAAKSILIYPRLAAPTSVAYDKANILLTGINNTMQYRLESSTSWTSLSGTTLNLLSKTSAEKDIKVLVRYKPTTANSASLPVEFIIPKLLDGPSCSIDYLNEKIIGLDDNISYQYYIGSNPQTTSNWLPMSTVNGSFDISGIITSYDKIINIRKAATTDQPITNYTVLNLSARKAAPTEPYFVYNNNNYYDKAVLTNVTSDMEYRISSDLLWATVGSDDIVLEIPNSSVTYYIRYKSTSENFASQNKSISLSKKSTAPALTYNTTTETITGLSTAMEISYDGSEYIPIEKGVNSLDLSERITKLAEPLTINIRRSATATTPASMIKAFTINSRLSPPTNVVYNQASISLSGVSAKMQYRFETSSSWTTFTGTTFNLLAYANKDQDVKLFVRYGPTSTNSASLPVEFIIPKLLDGPVCSIDYLNEKIIGLDDNISYQYYIGSNPKTTSNWLSMSTVNGSFDISGIVTSYDKIINIRKAATTDQPITNYTVLNLSARKAAPTEPYFVYNNNNYYDKAVLTCVTPDMEYKLSTDMGWREVIDNEVVLDVPDYNMTYYVRYKSNSESFSSSYKGVLLFSRRTAPNCTYNQSTQTITNLTNNMEIKIGETGEYAQVTSTTYNLSDAFISTNSVTVYIRYKANNTQPASYVQIITCNCNANIISNELDIVFNDTAVEDYDPINPNEELENVSDVTIVEDAEQINPDRKFEELPIANVTGDYTFIETYMYNDDLAS